MANYTKNGWTEKCDTLTVLSEGSRGVERGVEGLNGREGKLGN